MDGHIVFRKGGQSLFGFRRKSRDYEVWTTDEGIDVKSGGKTRWSITAGALPA